MFTKSLQSFLTLCDPMDGSPPGSFVHGISKQEYWSVLPCPSPVDLPDPGMKPCLLGFLHQEAGSLPLALPEKPQQTPGLQTDLKVVVSSDLPKVHIKGPPSHICSGPSPFLPHHQWICLSLDLKEIYLFYKIMFKNPCQRAWAFKTAQVTFLVRNFGRIPTK